MAVWMLPLVVSAAGAWAVPAAADDAARARALEAEASELSQELLDDSERFARETVGLAAGAAVLSDQAGDADPRAAAAVAEALRRADEHQRAQLPLRVRVALLGEELGRYRETGLLSPTPADAARRIERRLRRPWGRWAPSAEELSPDLVAMQRQLKKWDAVAPSTALVAAREKRRVRTTDRGESARVVDGGGPVAARRPLRSSPLLMSDAGRGAPKADPLPALLAQLAKDDARRRALAAEELGQLRAEAALPALRRALGDRDARVRASAALALGEVGIAAAPVIADLQRALADPDEEVRVDTRTALSLLVRR